MISNRFSCHYLCYFRRVIQQGGMQRPSLRLAQRKLPLSEDNSQHPISKRTFEEMDKSLTYKDSTGKTRISILI